MNIRVSEIFGPTIQGEGALIGKPTVFVRTGGCDYRCTWCDTLHAVDSKFRHEWKPMNAAEIMAKIEQLSGGKPILITLSGGNPAIQPLGALIQLGKEKGYDFTMETQGSIAADWFAELDYLTLSPKPPSSDMETDWAAFDDCIKAAGAVDLSIKIIIADEADYTYALDAHKRYPDLPLFLQPCNPSPEGDVDQDALNESLLWLVERMQQDQFFKPTILPQLHVMLWGNKKGV